MPGIEVFVNPYAGGNKRGRTRAERLADIVRDHGEVHCPTTLEELDDELSRALDKRPDVVALCGGTTPVAVKADIKIVREYRERQGKPIILSANLDEILKQGDLSQNIPLKDWDLVYVPRSVIGDVNEFIEVLTPSLDLLMNYPSGFRDAYALDPNKLRW